MSICSSAVSACSSASSRAAVYLRSPDGSGAPTKGGTVKGSAGAGSPFVPELGRRQLWCRRQRTPGEISANQGLVSGLQPQTLSEHRLSPSIIPGTFPSTPAPLQAVFTCSPSVLVKCFITFGWIRPIFMLENGGQKSEARPEKMTSEILPLLLSVGP